MNKRVITRPWEVICSDIVGPLPMSRRHNRFILVIADLFTKYVLIFALKSATSNAVVEHLEKDVFMMYGVPEQIICNNGRQYVSHKFKKVVASYDCKIAFTTHYHPQANPTQRINRILKTMIRSYVGNDHRTWDENIHKFGFALRTAVHEVTGYTPAFLNFGREIYLSGKVHRRFSEFPPGQAIDFGRRDDLAHQSKELKSICDSVVKRLEKAYEQSSHRYNLRTRPLSLEIGQVVWKRNFCLSDAPNYFAQKLAPKYMKCRVVTGSRRLCTILPILTQADR